MAVLHNSMHIERLTCPLFCFISTKPLFLPCGKATFCSLLGIIKNRAESLILLMSIGRC